MKHLKILCLAFLLCTVWACRARKTAAPVAIEAENMITAAPQEMPLRNIARHIRLIPLETTGASLIKKVNDVVTDGKHLYILNGPACCVYEMNGKFIGNLGQKGRGPHEYLHIDNVFLGENEVWLYDSYLQKIFLYHPDGQLQAEISLKEQLKDITALSRMRNGDFVTFTPDKGSGKKTMLTFFRLEKDPLQPGSLSLRLLDSLFHPYLINTPGNITWYFKEGQFIADRASDKFKCTLNDTIYALLPGGQGKYRLAPQYYLSLGKYKAVPDARVSMKKQFATANPFKIMAQTELLGESEKYIFWSARAEPAYFYDKDDRLLRKWRLLVPGKEAECRENGKFYRPLRIDEKGRLLGVMDSGNETDNPVIVIAELNR